MERWVSLGVKEGRTNIQISAEPGIELGTLWSEGIALTNCAKHAYPNILKPLQFYVKVLFELTAAVLETHVGEPPEVPITHSKPYTGKDKF